MRGWWRSRRVCKLPDTFSRIGGAAVPNKILLRAVVAVPWAYALLWYLVTNSGEPRLAWWANWGWLAILAFEGWGFFAIRAQERRQPPS